MIIIEFGFILLFKLIKSNYYYCSNYNDCFMCNMDSFYEYRKSSEWINGQCLNRTTSHFSGIEEIFNNCSALQTDNYGCGEFEYYDLKNNTVDSSYTKDKFIILNITAHQTLFRTGLLNYCSFSYEIEDIYSTEIVEIYFEPNYYASFEGFGFVTYAIDGKEYKEKIIHKRNTIQKVKFNTTMEFKNLKSVKLKFVYDYFYNSFFFKLTLKRRNNTKLIIIIILIIIASFILLGILIFLSYKIYKKCKENRSRNNFNNRNNNYIINVNNNDNILTNSSRGRNLKRKVLISKDEVLINPQFLGPKKFQKKCQKYNTQCTICLNSFDGNDIVSFARCSHLFHYKCLISHIKSNNANNSYKSNCPNCKTDIINNFYKTIDH